MYSIHSHMIKYFASINPWESPLQETIVKEYQNYKFQQPYQQAMYYCSLIMQDHSWPWMEQLEVLPNLEADALSKFVPLMLSKAYFECYIAGWNS